MDLEKIVTGEVQPSLLDTLHNDYLFLCMISASGMTNLDQDEILDLDSFLNLTKEDQAKKIGLFFEKIKSRLNSIENSEDKNKKIKKIIL